MNVAEEWFTDIMKMTDGQQIIIPVQDKRIRTKLIRELKELKDSYALVDPAAASKIEIKPDFKDGKWYIKALTTTVTSLVGVLVDANGVPREISIERRESGDVHLIKTMLRDGLSLVEIEDNLGRKLTEEERRTHFGKE
jgi:hypothetical protein